MDSISFSGKKVLFLFPVFLLIYASGCTGKDGFEKTDPENAGFSSEELKKVSVYAGKIGTGAITALYDGKLFYSWGDTSKNFPCHSIRKPFLGALYGIYSSRPDKKIIDIRSTLEDLAKDDIPPSRSRQEKQASVRDLLMSRSGVYHEAAAESEKMKRLRPDRGSRLPGTFFYYNNWDFNVLGTIFEKTTGKNIFISFKKEIAARIGMKDFSTYLCSYSYDKDLSEHPA